MLGRQKADVDDCDLLELPLQIKLMLAGHGPAQPPKGQELPGFLGLSQAQPQSMVRLRLFGNLDFQGAEEDGSLMSEQMALPIFKQREDKPF